VSSIPIVGEFAGPALEVYSSILQEAQSILDDSAPYIVRTCDYAVDALKLTREAADSLGPVAADNVASSVAQANSTTFGSKPGEQRFDTAPELNPTLRVLSLGQNIDQWVGFSKVYDGAQRGNARDVILNSRDQFSTQRGMGPVVSTIDTLLEYST